MRPTTGAEDRYQQNAAYMQENATVMTPLTGKEKNLKDVLMNLHDDFEAMNK